MDIMELIKTRRTYRRFEQKAVPQDVLDDILESARIANCGANRQALSYIVINKPEDVKKVNGLVHWAAFLPKEDGTPKEDEIPTLFVAVIQDLSVPGSSDTDAGIAIANMTTAAWAKGVGSCIMGAIERPQLAELFGLKEATKVHTMIAFGYPSHKSFIVPVKDGNLKYFLDENRNYCVPKKSLDEVVRYYGE